jgi:hypothetical protein
VIGAYPLQYFQAGQSRQADIQQDHKRQLGSLSAAEFAGSEQIIKRLLTVANHIDAIDQIRAAQCAQREQFVMGIVFD